MSPRTDEAGGLLLVDKPAGRTSHDVVAEVRRGLDTRRVGHTGTLDPFATGLLLCAVGRLTRLVRWFHLLPKLYRATLRLGIETDSHDLEGEPVGRSDGWRDLPRQRLERALAGRVGVQSQRPPDFSAKRVGGRRAHDAARRGETVELEPVTIRVHALGLEAVRLPEAELLARVSTGTYVRALARDLGRELGIGAHLSALRRLAVGPFRVEDATGIRELAGHPGLGGAGWLAPAEAVSWMARRALDAEEARAVGHGRTIPATDIVPAPRGDGTGRGDDSPLPVALLRKGRLVAVAEPLGSVLQPRCVLEPAP